jgi:hypothetical protein
MKIPNWYMEEFFPSGELRDAIVKDTGELKSLAVMDTSYRSPQVKIVGNVKHCAKALTAMREPVVSKALGLPYLGDLIPDKYHVYRHLPPYWAVMWYKKKLTSEDEWGNERFVADYFTALIIEFPWEQVMTRISRRTDKKKFQWVNDPNTSMVFAYHKGTLKGVAKMLETFKLPVDDDTAARIFLSRFLWYCYIMNIDTLSKELTGEQGCDSWTSSVVASDIRTFMLKCLNRDNFNPAETGLGEWGGLMAAEISIGNPGIYSDDHSAGFRMQNRLRIMLMIVLAALPHGCSKKILEGLMTFSAIVAGVWMLEFIKPVLGEVNSECR